MRSKRALFILAVFTLMLGLLGASVDLAVAAHARGKVEFEYLTFPETTFIDSERQMDICLYNHGPDGEVIYDGIKE